MKRFFLRCFFFTRGQSRPSRGGERKKKKKAKRRLFLRPFSPSFVSNRASAHCRDHQLLSGGEKPRKEGAQHAENVGADRRQFVVDADVVAPSLTIKTKNSPLELDEGLALADIALDGHDCPVALALVADVGAAGVL